MLLNQLTSRQVTEWLAFNELEPIGDWRADYRTAMLISVMVNIARAVWGSSGKREMTSPLDFLPDWSGEERSTRPTTQRPAQTVEEMKEVLKNIARFHEGPKGGGKVKT